MAASPVPPERLKSILKRHGVLPTPIKVYSAKRVRVHTPLTDAVINSIRSPSGTPHPLIVPRPFLPPTPSPERTESRPDPPELVTQVEIDSEETSDEDEVQESPPPTPPYIEIFLELFDDDVEQRTKIKEMTIEKLEEKPDVRQKLERAFIKKRPKKRRRAELQEEQSTGAFLAHLKTTLPKWHDTTVEDPNNPGPVEADDMDDFEERYWKTDYDLYTRFQQSGLRCAFLVGRDLDYAKRQLRTRAKFVEWLARVTTHYAPISYVTAMRKIALWNAFKDYPLLSFVACSIEVLVLRAPDIHDYLTTHAKAAKFWKQEVVPE